MYGPVPPDAIELKVTDWPASRFVDVEGAIVALSAVLTVTRPESIELAVVGIVALSRTMTFAFSVFPIRLVLEVNGKEDDAPNWFAIIVWVIVLKTMKL